MNKRPLKYILVDTTTMFTCGENIRGKHSQPWWDKSRW